MLLVAGLSGCEENNDNNTLENTPPTANFDLTPTNSTVEDEISFIDESYDPDGEITAWTWDFGDGNDSGSNKQNPTHSYSVEGTYNVFLTVTDDKGASDTVNKTIEVSKDDNGDVIKYGVVYLYWNDETYNSDWNERIPPLFDKAKNALYNVTEGTKNYSFDILGSYKTEEFCWNPSRLAWASQEKRTKIDTSTWTVVEYQESDYINETDEYHRGDPTNLLIIPGSDFGTDTATIDSYEKTIVEDGEKYLIIVESDFYYNDCENCRIYEENRTERFQELFPDENYSSYKTTYLAVTFDDDKNLVKQKFNSTKRGLVKERAAQELGFDRGDYDDIILIFGRLGELLADESDINHYRRCHLSQGFVCGYSSLIFAENCLLKSGFLDGKEYVNTDANYFGFYLNEGWHIIVHELLHKLGAVDVYHTGTIYGVNSHWYEASQLDPRYNESVMGDKFKPCMGGLIWPNENGNEGRDSLCPQEVLDEVYLDKLNRQKIGLE